MKFPFDPATGDLISSTLAPVGQDTPALVWRDNVVFEDTLRYVGTSGGRSSMSLIMRSNRTRASYPMFWKDFEPFLRGADGAAMGIFGLEVRGRWTFCKCGRNYGVRPEE